ncbi:hypothetical protein ACIBD9_23935 [Micromonospora sp. NPDC050784]|uniref:hypothetical protein n=1 Tax=Micromonospora sp. NPDC050784 TaxID=3364281 RepID=UPI00378D2ACE
MLAVPNLVSKTTSTTAEPSSASTTSPTGPPAARGSSKAADQEYALANEVDHPRNVYLREDALTDPLDEWLASAFNPDHLDQTITAMCDAQPTDTTPQTAAAQATIAACDAKLAQYRAALDAGADPALVTGGSLKPRPNGHEPKLIFKRPSRQSHAG